MIAKFLIYILETDFNIMSFLLAICTLIFFLACIIHRLKSFIVIDYLVLLGLYALVMDFVNHILFFIMTDIFGTSLVHGIETYCASINSKVFNLILQIRESYLQIMNVFLATLIVNWRYRKIVHFYCQRVHHLVLIDCYLSF